MRERERDCGRCTRTHTHCTHSLDDACLRVSLAEVITAGGRYAKQYERWQDPLYVELFNRTVYAPYMQGAGYVLSADVAAVAVRRAGALPMLPAVEDALVGTLVEGDADLTSRPTGFRHKNRDDYAVTVCAQDTEFVLLHKLGEEDLARCRAATQRRRSGACPRGPCVCRNLGRRKKPSRKVVRTFADAERAAAAIRSKPPW